MIDTSDPASGISVTQGLCSFIEASPSPYHTIRAIRGLLDEALFSELQEAEPFELVCGGSYYVVRNSGSIIAFHVGKDCRRPSFRICASHSDSPTFCVKSHATLTGPGPYERLDVEAYGGVIDRTWLDRPLSLAGRVMVSVDDRVEERLMAPDRDLLVIPSVAIHFNRDVNEKGAIDRAHDIYPLYSQAEGAPSFTELVASEVEVEADQVLSWDLGLSTRQKPTIWGPKSEFVSAPHLDDLQCAYGSLVGFIEGSCSGEAEDAITVYCCFNNEEVGSSTLQGAQSTFFSSTIERICYALDGSRSAFFEALARSFVISCDNAHAVHPNHPELSDEVNRAYMNGGVVIKEAARKTYATDGFSSALFEHVCRKANVPTQRFANRSDIRGGSTLGNLLLRGGASVHTVDIGLAQLAMHSSFETAGTADTTYLARSLSAFYRTAFEYVRGNTILFQ